jgi:hypothetical protein
VLLDERFTPHVEEYPVHWDRDSNDAMVEIEVRFSECASDLLFWNQDKT